MDAFWRAGTEAGYRARYVHLAYPAAADAELLHPHGNDVPLVKHPRRVS